MCALCSFVGNIPFEATEQQVRDILNTVGPLQNLRLVHDSKTGKPKGYGFAEYLDAHTASSAIRNLNNHDLSQPHCTCNRQVGERRRARQVPMLTRCC